MGVSSAAEKEPQKTSEVGTSRGHEKLGGARADFVANLGKRRVEIRMTLDSLRADPTSKRHRDELRRRVHALAAGAKLLRFPRLSDELKLVEARLEGAVHEGYLDDGDFGAVQDLIGRMTSLAWGQTEDDPVVKMAGSDPLAGLRVAMPGTEAPARQVPVSVLVVGGSALADALVMPGGRSSEDDGQLFDLERTTDATVALDLAKALAPDVAVVDGEAQGAKKLVQDLLGDALTESIPIIVTLRISKPDDAGAFLALGVAQVLPKPVSPSELRRACASVHTTYVRREIVREPLGDVTLDQLGARLAEELRRGLCDTVDPTARSATMELGEGTELLAALWGAVARIRDVVTIRTQGQVRFANGGPEGAVPLAPWLESGDSVSSSKRAPSGRVARADAETSLEKAKILVADDDAAVCWFLAGVLKTAGATVYEARDGERALEVAKHVNPDLVVTDILMPKMDGFSLSRVLRKDVALRDVPIVLLSWKEDLLQRVRELGADADGYMRKEASAGAIVQRVRELVRQRKRVAQRVASKGEIRGRLDGLTTYSLLRMVCQTRESATVAVRDASFLYEVEIRRNKPVRATRTALSGAFERGSSVLAALLGVGDGRFSVSPPKEDTEVGPVRFDLGGSLADQITPVIATARAAQRLLSGANLMRVKRVEIDEDALAQYASATPEMARVLLSAIAAGTCPRDLITGGATPARLLEDVLLDAAVHGAVFQVIDASGEDRLPEATAQELALVRGEKGIAPIASLPVLGVPNGASGSSSPISVALPQGDILKMALTRPAESRSVTGPVIDAAGNIAPLSAAAGLPYRMTPSAPPVEVMPIDESHVEIRSYTMAVAPPAAPEVEAPVAPVVAQPARSFVPTAPSVLVPAMLAEEPIAKSSTADGGSLLAAVAAALSPSLAAPSHEEAAAEAAVIPAQPPSSAASDAWALSPDTAAAEADKRSEPEPSPPPASGPRALTPPPAAPEPRPATPRPMKVEPPAPAPEPKAERAIRELSARELTPTPSSLPPPPGLKPMLTLGSLHPPPVAEQAAPVSKPKNTKKSPAPAMVVPKEAPKGERNDPTPRFPLPSAFLSSSTAPKKKDHKTLYWIAFALVGVVFAVWARWSRDKSVPSESQMIADMTKATGEADSQSSPAAPSPADDEVREPIDEATKDTKADQAKGRVEEAPIEELPLRDGDKLKKGQGLLEIVAGKSDTVFIDGKPIGSGPVVSLPLKARKDAYEIKVKTRGEERSRFVTVKEGKLLRLRLAPPWQR